VAQGRGIMAELKRIDDGRAELSGNLLHSTVTSIMQQGKNLIAACGGSWTVDMQGVDKVSSSGVALVLEWLRVAEGHGYALKIRNLPEHMRPIIDISDLDPLFESLLA